MLSLIALTKDSDSLLVDLLKDCAFDIRVATGFLEAVNLVNGQAFDLALVDLDAEGHGGFHLVRHIAESSPNTRTIALVGPGMRSGQHIAQDAAAGLVVRKPVSRLTLRSLVELLTEPEGVSGGPKVHSLIGTSSGIRKIRRSIEALKGWLQPILITGETGVGKEVVAHALHEANKCRRGPLITVDCGAISPSLLENELFGHAKGAYTGAWSAQKGLVLAANGGTLFFDEIGDLPLECQSRLLRVLQEREIRPLGGTSSLPIDVRICAATHVNLEEAVEQKRFREDLYYRLSAVSIKVPPLRERREDIPLLANQLLRWSQVKQRLSIDAHLRMMEYDWPGNVRELHNRLLRASALSDGPLIRGSDIAGSDRRSGIGREPRVGRLRDMEREEILRTVNETNNDILEAARRLGIGKTTLYRKLKVYRSLGAGAD